MEVFPVQFIKGGFSGILPHVVSHVTNFFFCFNRCACIVPCRVPCKYRPSFFPPAASSSSANFAISLRFCTYEQKGEIHQCHKRQKSIKLYHGYIEISRQKGVESLMQTGEKRESNHQSPFKNKCWRLSERRCLRLEHWPFANRRGKFWNAAFFERCY